MNQGSESISIRNSDQDKTTADLLAEGKLDVDELYNPTAEDLKKLEERRKANEEVDKLINSDEFNEVIEAQRNIQKDQGFKF